MVRALCLSVACGGLLTLCACEEVVDPCELMDGAPATVCVQDEDGDPLKPTSLIWSYPPESEAWDGPHDDATCADDACTVWALPDDASGEVVVVGTLSGPPHYTPGCVYYDNQEVSAWANAASPELVILVLDTGAAVCN